MSKIIIVEGIDNCGKDTVCSVINNIIKDGTPNSSVSWYSSIINVHNVKPCFNEYEKSSSFKMEIAAANYYSKQMSMYIKQCFTTCENKESSNNFIILNRSYFSEYVYAPMYRNVEEQHAEMMLNTVNTSIINTMFDLTTTTDFHSCDDTSVEDFIKNNFYYIQCDAPTTWTIKHDDFDSQSNADEMLIKEEKSRFNSLYNKIDYIQKHKLSTTVNNESGTVRWKTKDELYDELKQFLVF